MPTPARRYDPIITRGLGRQVRRAALGMDALIGGRRVGRDDDPVSVEDCCAVIRGMLRALPPEDGVELLERMRDMADSGDPEVAAELGAEDDPPDFPGMPRTGGTTPSATRPSLAPNGSAQDSAPRGGLYDRFPNAKRIGFGY